MNIRRFGNADLAAVAAIHGEAFPRQGHSREWIAASARAYPRTRLYVAETTELCGYIAWTEKSGFRAEAASARRSSASHYRSWRLSSRPIMIARRESR